MPLYLALGFTQDFCLAVVGTTTQPQKYLVPQFIAGFLLNERSLPPAQPKDEESRFEF